MKSVLSVGCVAFVGFASLGCSAGDDGSHESASDTSVQQAPVALGDDTLVLSVEIEAHHKIDFHEVQAGDVVAVETMKPGMTGVISEIAGLTILEQYEWLKPGEAVPSAIFEAQERAEVFRAHLATLPPDAAVAQGKGGGVTTGSDLGLQPQHSSSSGSHFISDGYCPTGNVYDVCRTNWMNGFYGYATSDTGYWYVDAYDTAVAKGHVTVWIQHPTNGGCQSYSRKVYEGTVGGFSGGCIGARTQRRIDVGDAANDAFHVGGYWSN